MEKKIPTRSEIAYEDTWATDSIFASVDDWKKAFQQVEQDLITLNAFQGHLGDSPQKLLEWFQTSEKIVQMGSHVILYARLNYSVDTINEKKQGYADQASGLMAKMQGMTSFDEPEILAIGESTIKEWMEAEPSLKTYAHYFERLFSLKEHILSVKEEALLKKVMGPFTSAANTHGILANADMQFTPAEQTGSQETAEVAHSNIIKLMTSTDLKLRRTAWQNYADGHLAFKNTIANCLSTGIKQDWYRASTRGYESCLAHSLGENFIPLEVFHNLIDTFKKHLPTWHRYWALRKKALKLKDQHVYDTRTALTENMPHISFEQAIDWISDGLAPLGEEYVSILRKGALEERWVDKYPNVGKRFGAFSSGTSGTRPFIMISFNNDVFGMSTLAHELGHSMHSYYTRDNQPMVYHNYGLFLAEVASNFNQAMVRAHLLETQTDRDLQIALIEEAMSNFRRYFFIMPTLARFEYATHSMVEQGKPLTARNMMDLCADFFAEGYGPDVIVDRDRVGSVWMQFSTHLYREYYVYMYATGISGAHALANGILREGEPKREAYIEKFLKAGGSRLPLETLKLAGVDLTTPAAVEETFGVLSGMVDKLEELIS